MNDVANYLRIPDDYEGNLHSLRWSPAGDVVERFDRSTFLFAGEIALFLEGYASVGPLIHFSYILYVLHLLKSKATEPAQPGLPATGFGREIVDLSDALASAFQKAGKPYRNAGALCAWLCRDIPPVVDPPDPAEVCLRLQNGTLAAEMAVWRTATAPIVDRVDIKPPLAPLDFDIRFLNALKELSPDEIACWLKHGREPLPDPGRRVAEAIVALKPRTLEGALAKLSIRERLSGAVPMVAQLVSALTLPPRRLAHQALPSGGYADVATRGRPEQILPSQFAVDDVEFLRRFAENELLYFHREEPHAPVTEELVLVLDQGVRTWGKVRHALNASALAFGKVAARRKIPLLIASTAAPGRLFDPLRLTDEELGQVWEASDLSPNPALALDQVFDEFATRSRKRDIVVLSHPRSVLEADFAASTRRATEGTRVFSVSIDEPGQVQFREWRRGVPVKVGDFRVDFSPPSGPTRRPSTAGLDPRGWRGDVEPVPFPFRFGVTQRIERPLFDFDYASRWLLLCTQRGILHIWKLDGTAAEILPRAMVEGEVLEQVDAVLGVADGFVVGGRVGKTLVAMHYDLGSRTARAYPLGPTFEGEWAWFYSRDVHIVVARGKTYSRAVDLQNREIYRSRDTNERPTDRAIRAFESASNHSEAPPRLPVLNEVGLAPERGGYVRLDRASGEIWVDRVSPPWEPFTPLANGKPMLRNCWLDDAQLRGQTLALSVSGPGQRTRSLLFRGPNGIPIRELATIDNKQNMMMLSIDGRLIARKLGERQIEVRETSGIDHPILITTKGRTHSDAKVTLGRFGMLIHVGKYVSLIRWDRDKLTVSTVTEGSTRSEHEVPTWQFDRPATSATPLPAALRNQSHRFVACARAELIAVVDVFGQIALFDKADRLVAMFLAFRGQVAAWTPDGTRFGPAQGANPLIDGPVTKNAAEIIGKALKDATDAVRSG